MSSITELISKYIELSSLVSIIEKLNFSERFSSDRKITLFAPTNDAFQRELQNLNLTFDQFLSDLNRLENIFNAHIILDDLIYSKNVKDGLNKESLLKNYFLDISIENDVMSVNGINVSRRDIIGENIVVHIVDRVILPPI